jgi:hypothetical protein
MQTAYLCKRRHDGRRFAVQERRYGLYSLQGLARLHQLKGSRGEQRRIDPSRDSTCNKT